MACEINVEMREKGRKLSQKTRVYKKVIADFTDDEVDRLVDEAAKQFGGDPMLRKCKVTITLIDK